MLCSSYGEGERDICTTLERSECAPSHCDYRNRKVQRLRLDRHGLSRPSWHYCGESNIGGPGGRKRAGVGSALADRRGANRSRALSVRSHKTSNVASAAFGLLTGGVALVWLCSSGILRSWP